MKKLITMCVVVTMCTVQAMALDINGGSSWDGWTYQGQSDLGNSEGEPGGEQLGIYAGGSRTAKYDVYSSVFSFNNDQPASGFAPGTYSSGAFANGNRILGIGVKVLAGSTPSDPRTSPGTVTVKFDINADSYFSDWATIGAVDSMYSFSKYSDVGDFTAQFEANQGWRPSGITIATTDGNPSLAAETVTLPGGSTGYDFAFRALGLSDGSAYQMFFDLDAMEDLYGVGNTFDSLQGGGIGKFGENYEFFNIALNGLGDNNVVFTTDVPEPATMALLSLGGILLRRKK